MRAGLVGVIGIWLAAQAVCAAEVELKDGDRVVLIGGTLIEREAQFGFVETALTAAMPEKKIIYRNLGWSGDTVWAESRGIFDPPAAGYERMLALVKEQQPTLIVLAYGQNESFAGETGLAAFVKQYEKLAHDVSLPGVRLVFATPMQFAKTHSPLPDLTGQNVEVQRYAAAIRELAARKQAGVLDLTGISWPADASTREVPLTENGVHPTKAGYAWLANEILKGTGHEQVNWSDSRLQELRKLVVEKNEWFFHRWRPQNVTYLFGFRKHEQGNNAVEIPQFDPLIAKVEAQIVNWQSQK